MKNSTYTHFKDKIWGKFAEQKKTNKQTKKADKQAQRFNTKIILRESGAGAKTQMWLEGEKEYVRKTDRNWSTASSRGKE